MIHLIIPGKAKSLKNDRFIVRGKSRDYLVPSSRVTKYMNNTRNAIGRQLPADFTIYEHGVAVLALFYVYYKTEFPTADLDNSYTTCQECLQNTVINNDKQIIGYTAIRRRANSRLAEHTELFICEAEDYLEALPNLLNFMGNKENEYESIMNPVRAE